MRVSVIAQCYNHERFLVECLASIEAQSFRDFELIVVDDASPDNSVAMIRSWVERNRPETRVLALPANLGVGGALNAAVAEARGEFVIRVATDDVWEPDLLARLVSAMDESGDDTALAFSNAICIDERGAQVAEDFIEYHRPGYRAYSGRQLDDLAMGNYIAAPTVMVRRAALARCGPFDARLAYEDWDMWLRLAQHNAFVFVPHALARYRIIGGSLARELFEAPAPATAMRLAHTHCVMAEKVLSFPELGAQARRFWSAVHLDNAYKLFVHDPAERHRLRRGLRWYAHPRLFCVGMAALLGFSPAAVTRVKTYVGL